MVKKIGVLSLQGNFHKHIDKLKDLNVYNKSVRYPDDLDDCDALIIPGGESTTISLLLKKNGFMEKINYFSKKKPIIGICAGMVILSSNTNKSILNTLGIMNYTVKRNAWGRQINSFKDNIKLKFDNNNNYKAIFIRAPKISKIHKNLEILATIQGEPVMLTDGFHFACSFHPELSEDNRVYKYIIDKINE